MEGDAREAPARRLSEAVRSSGPYRAARRTVAMARLAKLRLLHRETGSSLCGWKAYRLARAHGIKPPAWALEVLDAAGDGIERLAERGLSGERLGDSLAEELGFAAPKPGARSPFTEYDTFKLHYQLAWEVLKLMKSEGLTADKAARSIAVDCHTSKSTVLRAYQRYRDLLEAPLD